MRSGVCGERGIVKAMVELGVGTAYGLWVCDGGRCRRKGCSGAWEEVESEASWGWTLVRCQSSSSPTPTSRLLSGFAATASVCRLGVFVFAQSWRAPDVGDRQPVFNGAFVAIFCFSAECDASTMRGPLFSVVERLAEYEAGWEAGLEVENEAFGGEASVDTDMFSQSMMRSMSFERRRGLSMIESWRLGR